MMTKRIYIILLMLCIALGARAQEATTDDECMPPLEELSAQEQSSWRDFLVTVCNDWKKLGPTGHNPALTFKDINTERIVVGAEYNLDDSTTMRATQQYDWKTINISVSNILQPKTHNHKCAYCSLHRRLRN